MSAVKVGGSKNLLAGHNPKVSYSVFMYWGGGVDILLGIVIRKTCDPCFKFYQLNFVSLPLFNQ